MVLNTFGRVVPVRFSAPSLAKYRHSSCLTRGISSTSATQQWQKSSVPDRPTSHSQPRDPRPFQRQTPKPGASDKPRIKPKHEELGFNAVDTTFRARLKALDIDGWDSARLVSLAGAKKGNQPPFRLSFHPRHCLSSMHKHFLSQQGHLLSERSFSLVAAGKSKPLWVRVFVHFPGDNVKTVHRTQVLKKARSIAHAALRANGFDRYGHALKVAGGSTNGKVLHGTIEVMINGVREFLERPSEELYQHMFGTIQGIVLKLQKQSWPLFAEEQSAKPTRPVYQREGARSPANRQTQRKKW